MLQRKAAAQGTKSSSSSSRCSGCLQDFTLPAAAAAATQLARPPGTALPQRCSTPAAATQQPAAAAAVCGTPRGPGAPLCVLYVTRGTCPAGARCPCDHPRPGDRASAYVELARIRAQLASKFRLARSGRWITQCNIHTRVHTVCIHHCTLTRSATCTA
ncbi:hypothetical protein COO60DRAFT_843795 [Scenedesmus sp. NREL 46B-D3]|nr:hypothetical protein COO60DRAFT_843795 [Scenedesmus sp. NREL 46B-D3]